MVRWVAFDDDTAEAVVSRLRRGAAEISSTTPLDAALQAKGPSMVVLPASTPGRLLIAQFSKPQIPEAAPAHLPAPVRIATSAKKPVASAPKPWWRRFVA